MLNSKKTVKHNKTFKDGDGNTGDNVLPYDGKVTLKGNGVAEAAFSVDSESNETSMTLKIDGTDVGGTPYPYTKWDEVPQYDCEGG